MCNVFEQVGREVGPGGECIVYRMRGPGGDMLVLGDKDGKIPSAFVPIKDKGTYAGAAKSEKLRFLWVKHKGGEEVIIPRVNRFGDWHVKKNKQLWHELPPGTAMKGVLLPEVTSKAGKPYRLLKVQTRAATPEEEEVVGNDRMPVTFPWPNAPDFEPVINPKRETKAGRALTVPKEALPPKDSGQMELF